MGEFCEISLDNRLSIHFFFELGAPGDRGADFANKAWEKIMFEELNGQIEMGKFKGKTEPKPLHLEAALNQTSDGSKSDQPLDHRIPSLAESTKDFLELTKKLSAHADCGSQAMMFDKDFEDSMRFVSAAANIRMYQFHLPPQSYFENKGVAGNIVHAIATTNAIVSAAMVMEAIKVTFSFIQ